MCRLFGFRSVLQSGVHKSLIHAENALAQQSERHPDGWGVAYYRLNAPHILRSVSTAVNDSLFSHVSGLVSSTTVLAHLRKATVGDIGILNTHPFQYGRWVFAHNGSLENLDKKIKRLTSCIHPELSRFILGSTDSEIIFYLILTELQKKMSLEQTEPETSQVIDAVKAAVSKIASISNDYKPQQNHEQTKGSSLSFVLTDGRMLIAHHGGQELFFSTHKTKCSERETCPHLSESCETEKTSGAVNHLIIASEPLDGENVWREMTPNQIIGVDYNMNLFQA